MNPRRRSLGFILAAAGIVSALVLPLSSETLATLPARPILLALTLAAALLFAASAWTGGPRAIALGVLGVLCGAATTLVLLRDPGIAGSAAAGFWAMVLAVWLGAALCGGAFELVLFVYQRLGREEDTAASDAGPEAQGLRLAEVE